jgi:hypothetical protein
MDKLIKLRMREGIKHNMKCDVSNNDNIRMRRSTAIRGYTKKNEKKSGDKKKKRAEENKESKR